MHYAALAQILMEAYTTDVLDTPLREVDKQIESLQSDPKKLEAAFNAVCL